MFLTAVDETVPLFTSEAVATVTPDPGRVPAGVAVMVLVPAVCVAMVSSKVPNCSLPPDAPVRLVKAMVSSPLDDMVTLSTVCGCVVLPEASFRVTVTVPTPPTRTVCVAGVSVMLVGAPAVANEKDTVSVPL